MIRFGKLGMVTDQLSDVFESIKSNAYVQKAASGLKNTMGTIKKALGRDNLVEEELDKYVEQLPEDIQQEIQDTPASDNPAPESIKEKAQSELDETIPEGGERKEIDPSASPYYNPNLFPNFNPDSFVPETLPNGRPNIPIGPNWSDPRPDGPSLQPIDESPKDGHWWDEQKPNSPTLEEKEPQPEDPMPIDKAFPNEIPWSESPSDKQLKAMEDYGKMCCEMLNVEGRVEEGCEWKYDEKQGLVLYDSEGNAKGSLSNLPDDIRKYCRDQGVVMTNEEAEKMEQALNGFKDLAIENRDKNLVAPRFIESDVHIKPLHPDKVIEFAEQNPDNALMNKLATLADDSKRLDAWSSTRTMSVIEQGFERSFREKGAEAKEQRENSGVETTEPTSPNSPEVPESPDRVIPERPKPNYVLSNGREQAETDSRNKSVAKNIEEQKKAKAEGKEIPAEWEALLEAVDKSAETSVQVDNV